MCLGCFRQGQFFAGHRTQRSLLQTSHQRGVNTRQFCGRRVRQYHPANIGIALHGIARIELNPSAATNDHDASIFSQNGQIFPEIRIREHFHNDVNSAPLSSRHDLVKMVYRAMIEHPVRALFAHQCAAFVIARSAEDAETPSVCELHGRRPDSAAGAVHQHRFARRGMSALE